MNDDVWVFGYGSLIFRPSFPFLEQRKAVIRGFVRRLWQGSDDHRGGCPVRSAASPPSFRTPKAR